MLAFWIRVLMRVFAALWFVYLIIGVVEARVTGDFWAIAYKVGMLVIIVFIWAVVQAEREE